MEEPDQSQDYTSIDQLNYANIMSMVYLDAYKKSIELGVIDATWSSQMWMIHSLVNVSKGFNLDFNHMSKWAEGFYGFDNNEDDLSILIAVRAYLIETGVWES